MQYGKQLSRIDFRVIPLILALMAISLLVISSQTQNFQDPSFLTPLVKQQIRFFALGWLLFFLCATFDYNKLREWTWGLYILMMISLLGLFFTDPIQHVHRWYRIPFIHISFQPSETAKLVMVIALSWFLERRKRLASEWSTIIHAALIVGVPFILILKQPDLGTALILLLVALALFYFGGVRSSILRWFTFGTCLLLVGVASIFLEFISHEQLRPYATLVLKEYQFERLNPNTHQQKAAAIAIALGGVTGTGWGKSEFARGGWLPTPYTDSVFPAFGEEFGLLGLITLIALFYALIHCSFQVASEAKDPFGKLLAAGVAVYLSVHIFVNIGMMSGFLPITGVPLPLVSYGGTSILATMSALGLLQSIYSRRFMF